MALIHCPGCAREVSDRAAACPGCGCPVKEKVYTGRVSEFGFGRLMKAESGNFWLGRLRGEVHADRRIGITRGRLFKTWALGLLGTLGLPYFAAGRFITGSLRFLYGLLIWGILIGVLVTSDPQEQEAKWGIVRVLVLLLLLPPSVFDIAVMGLGRFRDVFGNRIKGGTAAEPPENPVPTGICPECKADAYGAASVCPRCGYPLRPPAPHADEMVRMAGLATCMGSATNGRAVLTDRRFIFGEGKLLKKMAAGEMANFTRPTAMGDVMHDIPLAAITAVTSGKQGLSTLLVIEANGQTYQFAFMKKAVFDEWEAALI